MKEKKLYRFPVTRTYSFTLTDHVFATTHIEAELEASRMPPTTHAPRENFSLVQTKVDSGLPIKDDRHPLLMPYEGKRVKVTFNDGTAIVAWVTPFGKGILNPMNSTICSGLSNTRRWDDSWRFGRVSNGSRNIVSVQLVS